MVINIFVFHRGPKMRILIDEDVHVKVLSWLKEKGHDTIRIPSGTKNGEVIKLAKRESRILITRDADFSNRFLYPPSQSAGIVVLRIHPPKLENLISALTQLLDEVSESDFHGKLIMLEEEGYHLLT